MLYQLLGFKALPITGVQSSTTTTTILFFLPQRKYTCVRPN